MGAAFRRYSVYRRSDEMPIIIFATAEKCAAAIGCTVDTFRSYLSRQKKGYPYPKSVLIYQDEVTEEDKKYIPRVSRPRMKDKDICILRALLSGYCMSEAARKLGEDPATILYHVKKIKTITGMDPRQPSNWNALKQWTKNEN